MDGRAVHPRGFGGCLDRRAPNQRSDGCFLRGGEDWERWNSSLKEVLLSGQEADGSFPPIGAYASYAGDTRRNAAFTTALCVLSLEVYYRYFTPLLSGR